MAKLLERRRLTKTRRLLRIDPRTKPVDDRSAEPMSAAWIGATPAASAAALRASDGSAADGGGAARQLGVEAAETFRQRKIGIKRRQNLLIDRGQIHRAAQSPV